MVDTKAAREPTGRELAILKVLWVRGEATVREVYEALRDDLGIVQNTVQAFLRTMTDKGLVEHRTVGRSFVYRATVERHSLKSRWTTILETLAGRDAIDRRKAMVAP